MNSTIEYRLTIHRILIIDDEESIQTVVKFGLTLTTPWQVITASSGAEGISKAQLEQPDVILLDVMMPEMDGISTFQELQRQEKTQHIPVIFLTAKAQASEKRLFKDIGVDGVITKPFNAMDLSQQIIGVLAEG
jgi:two-component system, OmpR family, alkaline phosphatase synthesis response regulator PhoP